MGQRRNNKQNGNMKEKRKFRGDELCKYGCFVSLVPKMKYNFWVNVENAETTILYERKGLFSRHKEIETERK